MSTFKIKRILVPVDFSETSDHAFQEALLLAKAANAEITLFHVITKEPNFDISAPIEEGRAFYDKYSHQVATRLDKMISTNNSVRITKLVKHGIVYKEICDLNYHEKFDLIVMGTHGTSGFNEFFSGSNAYRVVSHAGCPVITLQNKAKIQALNRIILPIRLDLSSRQKVDYIYEIAKVFGSTVYIAGFTSSKDESRQNKIRQYVNQVDTYLKDLHVNCISTYIFEKNFTAAILNYAKETNADLIAVMTSHDFSADQLIKGDYTKQLVNHSKFPILSVPVYSNPDLITYTPSLSGAAPY